MAVSGEIRRPPMGRFSWPPSFRARYRFSTNDFMAVIGVLPLGVNVPLAVSFKLPVPLSRRFPAAVNLTFISAFPGPANVIRPDATSTSLGWLFLASFAPGGLVPLDDGRPGLQRVERDRECAGLQQGRDPGGLALGRYLLPEGGRDLGEADVRLGIAEHAAALCGFFFTLLLRRRCLFTLFLCRGFIPFLLGGRFFDLFPLEPRFFHGSRDGLDRAVLVVGDPTSFATPSECTLRR